MREANLSVQRAALRIWEGGNHTSGTWGGVVGSMENLVERRGQSARLFFHMALVFIKKDIYGKSVYSGIKAYPCDDYVIIYLLWSLIWKILDVKPSVS